MKHKILLFIAITLGMVTGCASAGGTANTETADKSTSAAPQRTTAELEQMAQAYEYEGQFDEANDVYRQLIERNATNFQSVLYQHRMMLNAQSASDLDKLILETFYTVSLFEKAKDEHFDGATPEAIAKEKESIAKFLFDNAMGYSEIVQNNLNERLMWVRSFFISLYVFYYQGVLSFDDGKDELLDFLRSDEMIQKYEYLYSDNRYNMERQLKYHQRIYDLYHRGIITDDNNTPLNLIQNDIQVLKTEPLDAIKDYILAFSYHRMGPSDIKERHTLSVIATQTFRYYLMSAENCRYDICLEKRKENPQIPDCEQYSPKIYESYRRLKYLLREDEEYTDNWMNSKLEEYVRSLPAQ